VTMQNPLPDAAALAWALDILGTESHAAPVVSTPWSSVTRLSNAAGVFYLKRTPDDFWIEADILRFCGAAGLDCTPELIAANRARGCFLMKACGDTTLRDYFAGTADIDLLCSGIAAGRRIMAAAVDKIPALIALGVPDWRVRQLPEVFAHMLDKTALLEAEGLSADDRRQLQSAARPLAAACARLDAFGIPDTLCHCDFHDGNITLARGTLQTGVIDLGEVALTHPFFPLLSLERRLAGRYNIAAESAAAAQLRGACFDGWDIPAKDAAPLREAAASLTPLFFALAHIRLCEAAPEEELRKITRMQGRIRDALRETAALLTDAA